MLYVTKFPLKHLISQELHSINGLSVDTIGTAGRQDLFHVNAVVYGCDISIFVTHVADIHVTCVEE